MELSLSKVKDEATRQALNTVQDTFNQNELHKGDFKLFTIIETGTVTGKEFFHGLGFVPSDIIVTKLVGGPITWDWTRASSERIYYTTSGATEVRFLIGKI